MRYGLIGKPLIHSISPRIHFLLGLEKYDKIEISEEDLGTFIKKAEYDAFNVTIPYKEKIIPYLKELGTSAKEIGAVNTVVREGAGYIGYNTDANGMRYALCRANIAIKGKNVLILGTGGTSKTARHVCNVLGVAKITIVGRKREVNYENVYSMLDTEVIINTTPVGMFPNIDLTPIDVARFPKLSGVFDCVYNPKQTRLVKEAKEMGVNATNGLFMLIEQARKAEELFLGKALPEELTEAVAKEILF